VNSPVRQQPTVLRYVAYPPAERDGVDLRRVDSIDQDPTMVWIDQPIEAAKEGGFTRSAFSDQRYAFGSTHVDRHGVER
jgi:hypothetical protein